jgi:cytochrome P450
VPPELVVEFDYFRPRGIEHEDVYKVWARLFDGPDIVWTPCNGGHWIVTRAKDIRYIQGNDDLFSHEDIAVPRGAIGIPMPPLTVDPPEHAKFRTVLNPFFRSHRVVAMEDQIRAFCVELIDQLRPQGRCEFVADVARTLPVVMFLKMVDLPPDRRTDFLDWAVKYNKATDQQERDERMAIIVQYIATLLEDRTRHPGDDPFSAIAACRHNARALAEDDVLGMAVLLFFGGLDTVANVMAFAMRHLAEHPHLRRRLAAEPEVAPAAVEEFLRRYGLPNSGRLVKQDTVYKGVKFKRDDVVLVPLVLPGLDEREYERPFEVDFDRRLAGIDAFGNGPHRCVGAPLARLELRILLEEWFKRIPDFRVDPDRPPHTTSGVVAALSDLHLVWDL